MTYITGFSKLSKDQKIEVVSSRFSNPTIVEEEFRSFHHPDEKLQTKFEEFSENTISNFFMPFSVAPNFLINDHMYMVPMVIEESSVVAAASKAAKFWKERGGFKAEVIDTEKIGQVHFEWKGEKSFLTDNFEDLKIRFFEGTKQLTANMERRGGGISRIELVDMTEKEPNYYQVKAYFQTVDSMGANFVNTCLEEFAKILKAYVSEKGQNEDDLYVIMSILSNFTPNCLVKVWVECPIEELGTIEGIEPHEFAQKFEKAIKIAHLDPYRATTHNKGIYNGIDSVVLATGNDFRAVEACGHTYASKDGNYKSLSDISLDKGIFKFSLTVPMALGVVGGLTNLHPIVKRSLEMLENPSAKELMMIAAAAGLANNFAAVKSLTTSGIQKGHMKMHLINILTSYNATEEEKAAAIKHFEHEVVTFSSVREFLDDWRDKLIVQF